VENDSIGRLLAAYQQTGHQKPDPTTLKGLLAILRSMPDDSEAAMQDIERGRSSLLAALERAVWETQTEAVRLPEYSPLLDIYDVQLSAYKEAEDVLKTLVEEIRGRGTGGHDQACEALELVVEEIEFSQSTWRKWLNDPSPRCARCGHQGNLELKCRDCDCDLLYPDRSAERAPRRPAVLGADYKSVYDLYLRLQNGETTLEHFCGALGTIENKTRTWSRLLQNVAPEALPQESREVLEASMSRAIEGVELVYEARETREWKHINEGWNSIFESAVCIQTELPSLYRALGAEDEAAALEQSMRVRDLA